MIWHIIWSTKFTSMMYILLYCTYIHWYLSLAPELWRNEKYSETVDTYSFAMVLWELLARDQPFRLVFMLYHTIQQYNTIQYNTIQYNTIQYNTIQYNTIQYNTLQYNTTIPVHHHIIAVDCCLHSVYCILCCTISYSQLWCRTMENEELMFGVKENKIRPVIPDWTPEAYRWV